MTARAAIRVLQIVLGVMLCIYSLHLVHGQLRSPNHHAHLFVFLLALGAAEAVAAIVFLFDVRRGGAALLVVFAVAALFHLLRGQVMDVGQLAIYGAAVLVVMAHRRG